jgi:hypothetical protein
MRVPAGALAASLLCAGAAGAHHGFGSFDLSRDIELTGTLTAIDFVNPHSWLYLDVEGPDGAVTSYRCEMRGATVLRRSGWSPDLFTMGERITITGAPDRRDPNSCYLGTVTFSDGRHIDRYGQLTTPAAPPADRPARTASGRPNIAGDWANEQVVMTDPRGIVGTLVPLSMVDRYAPGEVPEGGQPFPGSRGADPSLRSFAAVRVPLTPKGQAAADAYVDFSEDNPRLRCESTSILFDWTFDGMIHRITQTDDVITVEYGQYGLVRTIRLDETSHPADGAPSRAGHSIGRWEGDVLVVDTTGFAPGLLSPPIHHGDQLRIVERFTFDPGAMTLRRDYEATDPEFFEGAYTGSDVVRFSPLPFSPDVCEDTSLIDYSAEGAQESTEP